MEITIKGEAKEMAALVVGLQERLREPDNLLPFEVSEKCSTTAIPVTGNIINGVLVRSD